MLFLYQISRRQIPLLIALMSVSYLLMVCPGLAQAQEPPKLQLAKVYHQGLPVRDYWVSEKLDGVRAYWDGTQLISKQGHIYHAPKWFIADFPAFPLDGELWLARNRFDLLSGIVRKQVPLDEEWRRVSFQIFDLPKSTDTFDVRLKFLQVFFRNTPSPSWLQLISQTRGVSHDALIVQLDEVVSKGGEGLMLHLGASRYHHKRNDELVKLKRYLDAEARVLAHLPGKGKFQGSLGSLLVEAVNGSQKSKRFKIGSGFTHGQRRAPPPIGSVIRYKYFGLTVKGLPRFASFMNIRDRD